MVYITLCLVLYLQTFGSVFLCLFMSSPERMVTDNSLALNIYTDQAIRFSGFKKLIRIIPIILHSITEAGPSLNYRAAFAPAESNLHSEGSAL